jgi:hypothetical protein
VAADVNQNVDGWEEHRDPRGHACGDGKIGPDAPYRAYGDDSSARNETHRCRRQGCRPVSWLGGWSIGTIGGIRSGQSAEAPYDPDGDQGARRSWRSGNINRGSVFH